MLNSWLRHDESRAVVPASPERVFALLDDHERLASHMSRPSWQMGGGRMTTVLDERRGQTVGSHIRMSGRVLGLELLVDEVVTEREEPTRKVWETVGAPRLLVIGPYRMGLELTACEGGSLLRVFIDYALPSRWPARWLGFALGRYYAHWCTQRMVNDAVREFASNTNAPPEAGPIRGWYRYWGATDVEIERTMLGDAEIPRPTYETTLAVSVEASAVDIWPWLAQMGYRRGGLYSYDWLDCLFGFLDAPSAERILPEFQRLKVGDVIPVGRGGGFPVKAIQPFRALVLGGESDGAQWMWQLGLYPVNDHLTRLVSRNRARMPKALRSTLFMCILEPAAFIMTRKMLLGLKRRAEASVTRTRDATTTAA